MPYVQVTINTDLRYRDVVTGEAKTHAEEVKDEAFRSFHVCIVDPTRWPESNGNTFFWCVEVVDPTADSPHSTRYMGPPMHLPGTFENVYYGWSPTFSDACRCAEAKGGNYYDGEDVAFRMLGELDSLAPLLDALVDPYDTPLPIWWAAKWGANGDPVEAAIAASRSASQLLYLVSLMCDVGSDDVSRLAVALVRSNLGITWGPNGISPDGHVNARCNERCLKVVKQNLPKIPTLAELMETRLKVPK